MSPHASVETLSAYLDEELGPDEAGLLEEHVEACDSCRSRLVGMRGVVASLRHMERMAPPPTLSQLVARRVVLVREERGLLDRLEKQLAGAQRQSPIFFLFALTIALAVIVLLFAQAVEIHQKSTIPVVFEDLPAATQEAEAAAPRRAAGRTFYLVDALWVEEGVDPQAVDLTLSATSTTWAEMVTEEPELVELSELDGSVVARLGGRTVRLDPADGP